MQRARIPREETATLCLSPAPGALVPAERLRARREAARLLDEAGARAARLLADARAQAEALRLQAREEGLAEGRRQATEHVAQALRARARAVEALLPELAELGVTCARRILAAELSLRPEAAVDIARRVIEANRPGRRLRLRVNPEDARALAADYRALAEALGVRLRLVADAAIGRGGCCLDGELGAVDGRLEVQLEGLREALRAEQGEGEVGHGSVAG
ncbi:MAG TPA: FliH/SctL family protein [Myxococcota bacterium]|nr:FliH/SctL family protein [Myxococcota bacterium]HRY92528.1 FliH/SctL family protein [Myxococcota bacterium]